MKGIWTYSDLLPAVEESARLLLGEGCTPLVKSRSIGPSLGLNNLYFKLENLNPSGSYKDRFAAMAVSAMLEKGVKVCLATSSGNTGAALSAFCALAGIPCVLAIVDGAPQGKLQQMQLYGAATLMIRDFGKLPETTERVMEMLRSLSIECGTAVQISAYAFCPQAMQGVQTIAYEIAETLNAPAQVFVPAGGGGLTLAVARGFKVWQQAKNVDHAYTVHCVQPEGNATIAGPLLRGGHQASAITRSETGISGLQVPNVLDGNEVISACRNSGGTGFLVSDFSVFECQQWLAKKEGIYSEPAGAVALAGVISAVTGNQINKDQPVVCMVTGHGFKDPEATRRMAEQSDHKYLTDEAGIRDYVMGLMTRDHNGIRNT